MMPSRLSVQWSRTARIPRTCRRARGSEPRCSGRYSRLSATERFSGELVAVLIAERDALRGAMGPESPMAPEELGPADALQDYWNGRVLPALADYLDARGLDRTRVLVTPTLSREGRFFAGNPNDPEDNVVIVGYGPGVSMEGAAAALVRELCFPVVREAFDQLDADRVRQLGRVGAARLSDAAATRCGRLLLERYLPDEVGHYDARFGPATVARTGETDLEDRLDRLMEDLIRSS